MKYFKPTPALSKISSAGMAPQTLSAAERTRFKKKPTRNSNWTRKSKAIRKARPICEGCGIRASVCVHHVVHLADDPSNNNLLHGPMMALCQPCHDALH